MSSQTSKWRYGLALLALYLAVPAGAQERQQPSRREPTCLSGTKERTSKVTQYITPVLGAYNRKVCDKMEGSCIYKKNGRQYLHNFGVPDQLVERAKCDYGYGADVSGRERRNCLHPCRSVAAHQSRGKNGKYKYGQILYFPELVGKTCGGKKHDGYMVISDIGGAIKGEGRFDFFWGACKSYNSRNHTCKDRGAAQFTEGMRRSPYCIVWDPRKANHPNAQVRNTEAMLSFVGKVRDEAIARGDKDALRDFDLGESSRRTLDNVRRSTASATGN